MRNEAPICSCLQVNKHLYHIMYKGQRLPMSLFPCREKILTFTWVYIYCNLKSAEFKLNHYFVFLFGNKETYL